MLAPSTVECGGDDPPHVNPPLVIPGLKGTTPLKAATTMKSSADSLNQPLFAQVLMLVALYLVVCLTNKQLHRINLLANMLLLRILLVMCGFSSCLCQVYVFPTVRLEAFKPSGFRASIKADPGIQLFAFHGNKNNSNKICFLLADPGIQLFAFHGNKNKEILINEPGEFSAELRRAEKGRITYDDPELSFVVGDVIHYWAFIQHNYTAYKEIPKNWTVNELKEKGECDAAFSIINDRTDSCVGDIIVEEDFQTVTDNEKWQIDHYIPVEPDYEFVVYKKDPDVVYTRNGTLVIKPKLVEDMSRDIDLRNGCTKSDVEAQESLCYQPKATRRDIKIISGRITSKVKFSYGEITIRAKLPFGDWIYPEVYLEEADDTKAFNKRILVAYSRGNLHFSGTDGINIGTYMLFGGPMASPQEPEKSRLLSSYRSDTSPFNKIELFVDEIKYGMIVSSKINESGFTVNPMKARLVLGVGVGGINDFPDNFKSSNNDDGFFTYYMKPWTNKEVLQEQKFFKSRSKWLPSWNKNAQLEVDYVKIQAL
nr:unnamed protein product [Callosobruchus analis]